MYCVVWIACQRRESELESAAQSTFKEMSQPPKGQPISRNLSSEICPSLYLSNPLLVSTPPLSLSPPVGLSFSLNISGSKRRRKLPPFDPSSRGNIPQIFTRVRLTKSGRNRRWPSASPRREKRAKRTTLRLRAQSIPYLGPPPPPHSRGDLETLTRSSGAFTRQAGDSSEENCPEAEVGLSKLYLLKNLYFYFSNL